MVYTEVLELQHMAISNQLMPSPSMITNHKLNQGLPMNHGPVQGLKSQHLPGLGSQGRQLPAAAAAAHLAVRLQPTRLQCLCNGPQRLCCLTVV